MLTSSKIWRNLEEFFFETKVFTSVIRHAKFEVVGILGRGGGVNLPPP